MKKCLGILFSVLFAACAPVKAGNPGPTPKPFGGIAGQIVTGTQEQPIPVAGATVQIDGKNVITDGNGLFTYTTITGTTENLSVHVRQTRFAPTVQVYPRIKMAGRFVTIHLKPVDVVKRINVKDGGVVVLPGKPGAANEVAVRFLPGALKINDTEIDVSLSVIRPHIDIERKAFPGEYVGIPAGPVSRGDLLRTLGTMDVSFSSDGKPLDNVLLSKPARLQIAMDDSISTEFAEGASIPTWWLNTNSGVWISEGFATVIRQNDQKIASWEVDHFTWWNADMPLGTHACAAVQLLPTDDVSKKELPNLIFQLEGVDYFGSSQSNAFNAEGIALATGWRGHKVKPVLKYIGSQNVSMQDVLLKATAWEPGFTFALPNTEASTYHDKGPEGVPLDPKIHCLQLTVPFTIRLGSVKGTVLDSFGKPQPGVIIAIPEIGRTTVSDFEGRFLFASVPYHEDGNLIMSVTALPPTGRQDLIFDSLSIKRYQSNSEVQIIAQVPETPPQFTQGSVSNNTPNIGSTIAFDLTVVDNGPALQWGIQHCHSDSYLTSKVDVAPDGKEMICHLPPGNQENVQTIAVGASALQAHLSHGDYLGACSGVAPRARPEFGDLSAKVAAAESNCTSELTDLVTVASQNGPQFVYHLRGAWHGGNTRERQEIRFIAKDYLGYETPHIVTATWRNNTPVITLQAPRYSPIGDFVTLDAGASDPDGDPITVAWRFNGVPAGDGQQIVMGPMVDGANYIEVDASDGQSTVTQKHTLLGTTASSLPAPDTNLNSTPGSPSSITMATFAFSSPLSTATFECKLDDRAYETCVSPFQLHSLANGSHTFIVRARNSQGTYDATPAFVTWDISLVWSQYLVSGSDFSDMAKAPDGGYVLIGRLNQTNLGGTWLARFNENGEIIWEKSVMKLWFESISAGVNGYCLSGFVTVAGRRRAWAGKVDLDANLLWQRAVTEATMDSNGFGVVASDDGGCLVVGNRHSEYGYNYDPALIAMKFDEVGNLTWRKSYNGFQDEDGKRVVKCLDGGFVISGTTDSFGSPMGGHLANWLLKIDGNGAVVWQQAISNGTFTSLLTLPTGEIMVAGYGDAMYGPAWLWKIGTTGSIIWQKQYGSGDWFADPYYGQRLYDLALLPDGGFVAIGGYGYQNYEVALIGQWPDLWMVKTDSLGNIDWQRVIVKDWAYDYIPSKFAYSVEAGPLDTIIVATYVIMEGVFVWLSKFPADGILPFSLESGIYAVDTTLETITTNHIPEPTTATTTILSTSTFVPSYSLADTNTTWMRITP